MFFFFDKDDQGNKWQLSELRKLTVLSRDEEGVCNEHGTYAGRVSRLADSLTSVPAEKVSERSLLAEDIMFQALCMIMHTFDYMNMYEEAQAEDEITYPYAIADRCAALVGQLLPEADDDLKAEVTEDMVRRICYVVYCACGTTFLLDKSEDGDALPEDCECKIYMYSYHDSEGDLHETQYDIDNFVEVLNMDKEDFIPEANAFRNKYCIDKDITTGEMNFDLWPINPDALHLADWPQLMSGDKEATIELLTETCGIKNKELLRKVRRQFTMRKKLPCPVDVEQLKSDAEILGESVQHRIDMIVDWLSSHQSLTEKYRLLHEEYDNLKKQLNISQAQRAVSGQERDEQAKKDCEAIDFISKCQDEYDIAMRNLSDVMLENNNLTEQVRNLQAQLAQANSTIADLKESIAAKKASEKVKVAQDQAEDARMKMKQLQDSWQETVTEEVTKSRSANIKAFMDGLRQRCKSKSPEKIGFLFDDLKDSSWGFLELQTAVRELYAELTAEPTQEERRTRAMERQADKPSAPIQMTVGEGGLGIGSIGEVNAQPRLDKPERPKEIEG